MQCFSCWRNFCENRLLSKICQKTVCQKRQSPKTGPSKSPKSENSPFRKISSTSKTQAKCSVFRSGEIFWKQAFKQNLQKKGCQNRQSPKIGPSKQPKSANLPFRKISPNSKTQAKCRVFHFGKFFGKQVFKQNLQRKSFKIAQSQKTGFQENLAEDENTGKMRVFHSGEIF